MRISNSAIPLVRRDLGEGIFKLSRSPGIDSTKNRFRKLMLPGGPVRQPYSYTVPIVPIDFYKLSSLKIMVGGVISGIQPVWSIHDHHRPHQPDPLGVHQALRERDLPLDGEACCVLYVSVKLKELPSKQVYTGARPIVSVKLKELPS
jgi:hypothetical protein